MYVLHAFENSSQVFSKRVLLGSTATVETRCQLKRRRTSGEQSGVGLRYEGRVVGFPFRVC